MSLRKGKSNQIREANIKEMIDSGHPPEQAVAASYAQQRKAEGKPAKRSNRRKK